MSGPLISILIPCHNAARWLVDTLESVLAQTWPHIEVILVNDGSTDESAKIAQGFASRGVRVAEQPRRGQSAACNHALRLAQGEYVKYLDADDLLSPDAIERQVRSLAVHPGCIAHGEWARFHQSANEAVFTPREAWKDAAPADWLIDAWSDGYPMMQCGLFLIPRDLVGRCGGWDERLSLVNDFEFFARVILASNGVVFTPGARLYYRSGLAGSLSNTKTAAAWESAFRSFTAGTEHLLRVEDSPRIRRAAATVLQRLAYDMYPAMPHLVQRLEQRVEELGGTELSPAGGRGFHVARRFLGWKAARRLQIHAGKFPRPAPRNAGSR